MHLFILFVTVAMAIWSIQEVFEINFIILSYLVQVCLNIMLKVRLGYDWSRMSGDS